MALATEQSRLLLCDLLALVSAGARGERLNIHINDWETMFRLAYEHNVLSLFACVFLCSPDLSCPENIREYALNVMRNSSSINTIRRQRIFHLLHELKMAEFDVKLLKGYAAARYYVFPESRDSVDTDIWVREDQELAVYAFLEERGFQVEERSLTSHHGICQHKKYGKIEVHTKLYDEIVEDIWFKGLDESEFVQEEFEVIDTQDGKYVTLGATDQLLFLTLHMIKHFIEGGLSIRMMLDIALHYTQRHADIDFHRYWAIMNELHYADLVSSVLWIMSWSAGFDVSVFTGISAMNPEITELLLDDLKTGGYMGINEYDSRLESAMEYNRQLLIKRKSSLQYTVYMLCWKIRSGYKSMFLSAKCLRKRYSFLDKMPALFPCVWLYQVISFPVEKVRSGVLRRDIRQGEKGMDECSKRRLAMFKKLGMF